MYYLILALSNFVELVYPTITQTVFNPNPKIRGPSLDLIFGLGGLGWYVFYKTLEFPRLPLFFFIFPTWKSSAECVRVGSHSEVYIHYLISKNNNTVYLSRLRVVSRSVVNVPIIWFYLLFPAYIRISWLHSLFKQRCQYLRYEVVVESTQRDWFCNFIVE